MIADDMRERIEQVVSQLEAQVASLRSLLVERPGKQEEQAPPGDSGSEEVDVPANLRPKLKEKLPEELAELETAIVEYERARGRHELNVAWRSVMDELADVANCAVSAGDDSALDQAIETVAKRCHVAKDSLWASLSAITKAKVDVVSLRPHEHPEAEVRDDDTGEEEIA